MSNRSSTPWIALAGVVVVLAAVAAFWLGGAGGDDAASTLPVVAEQTPESAGDLPPPVAPPESDRLASRIETAPRGAPAPPPAIDTDEPVLVIGWVEDVRGERLPDIEVNLYDDVGDFLDSIDTDEDGAFAFAWDEPLTAGWSVTTEPDAFSDGFSPGATVPAVHVHDAPAIPGEPPVEVRLVLAPAPRIEGFVFDAETRQPIELADVEAVCTVAAWMDEFQDTFTEEDGTFVLPLVDIPAQGVVLKITDDEDRFAIFGPLDLTPGEVRYLEVPLAAAPILTGTVVSARDGSPVDGAEVTLLPVHAMLDSGEAWDVTFEDGSFEIDPVEAPADRILLYTYADGFGPAVTHVPNTREPVTVRLGPPVEVRGTLTEKGTGQPVPDAVVRFVLAGPGGLVDDYEDTEMSDDDGTFALLLEMVPPEAAVLIVESDDHVRFRAELSDLVATGGQVIELQLQLQRRPGL